MTTEASTGKITDEQAGEALASLLRRDGDEAVETAEETVVAESAPAEAESTGGEEAAAEESAAPAETDDVASLKARLAEHETRVKEIEETAAKRAQAMQERFASNERILRDKFLRKSNVTSKALKILKDARSGSGVTEADADQIIREIESSMNPASASYAPPAPAQETVEDQAITLNSFLNEKAMSAEEADEFGKWMRGDASTVLTPYEQAVGTRDLDGFLRLAHTRWREGISSADKTKQRSEAVQAVKSVQRTQKEAARAASASPSAPRKTTPAPRQTIDLSKLKPDDVSKLLRQSVEEAKNS